MKRDAYGLHAGFYDRLYEPAAKILRDVGLTLFPPRDDIAILDVVFVLHEMDAGLRPAVLAECRRVLKPGGRIMLMDYQPGPYRKVLGRIWHLVITLMEISAGRKHFTNYRQFMATGGLAALVATAGLDVEQRYVSEHGVTAIEVLAAG